MAAVNTAQSSNISEERCREIFKKCQEKYETACKHFAELKEGSDEWPVPEVGQEPPRFKCTTARRAEDYLNHIERLYHDCMHWYLALFQLERQIPKFPRADLENKQKEVDDKVRVILKLCWGYMKEFREKRTDRAWEKACLWMEAWVAPLLDETECKRA